jgi:hypothetical protein
MSREVSEEERAFVGVLDEVRWGLDEAKRLVASHEAGGLDPEEQARALATARSLAAEGRLGFLTIPTMSERAPELFAPYASGLRACARLAYCLLALSRDEPEPLAVLSSSELETLLHDEGAEADLERLVARRPPREASTA